MNNLIITPRISEKAIALAEKGSYVFDVPTSANKIQIAAAVEKAFKVEVESVNTIISKGKLKRFRNIFGRQHDVKKALVKLKKGQSIALFEGAK